MDLSARLLPQRPANSPRNFSDVVGHAEIRGRMLDGRDGVLNDPILRIGPTAPNFFLIGNTKEDHGWYTEYGNPLRLIDDPIDRVSIHHGQRYDFEDRSSNGGFVYDKGVT